MHVNACSATSVISEGCRGHSISPFSLSPGYPKSSRPLTKSSQSGMILTQIILSSRLLGNAAHCKPGAAKLHREHCETRRPTPHGGGGRRPPPPCGAGGRVWKLLGRVSCVFARPGGRRKAWGYGQLRGVAKIIKAFGVLVCLDGLRDPLACVERRSMERVSPYQ